MKMTERTIEEIRNTLERVADGADGMELTPSEAADVLAALEPREPGYEGWAEVELMGHRRRVAYVRELELAHRGFLDLRWPKEVENADAGEWREIYSPSAVFCLTPIGDEAKARELLADAEAIPF